MMIKKLENALSSGDLRERRAALRQLAEAGKGNAHALALVIGRLEDKNANVRAEALRAAVRLAPEKTHELLQQKLLDHHSIVITGAIDIIREKGLKKFSRDLAGLAFSESHRHVKRTALQALIQLEPETARSILTSCIHIREDADTEKKSLYLPKGNPRRTLLDNAMLALELAEEWSDPDLIASVKNFLDRCSPQKIFLFPQYKMFHRDFIRRGLKAVAKHDPVAACQLVQRFPGVLRNCDLQQPDIDQSDADELRHAVTECTPPLRMSADDLIHIDEHDRNKAMRTALIMIHSENSAAQAAAAHYYRLIGDPQLVEILLPYLPAPYTYWSKDEKDIIRNAAFLDFRKIFHKIVEYLIACEGWEQRVFLARLLGDLAIPQNIHLLVPIALGHSRRDRNNFFYTVDESAGGVQEQIQAKKSILSLARIENGGLQQILELLTRRHPAVKKLAIEILTELGDQRAVRHLAALINDVDLDIATAAKDAIKRLESAQYEK